MFFFFIADNLELLDNQICPSNDFGHFYLADKFDYFYGSFYLTDKFDYFVSPIIYLTDKLDVHKASDLSVKCLKASILSVIYIYLALKSIGFVR